MSVWEVKKIIGCWTVVAALVCVGLGEAHAVPAINCGTAKSKCSAAVKVTKALVKKMNREAIKLESFQTALDNIGATYDECVSGIENSILNIKIGAQQAAETCGGGVWGAVDSASIWSARQLESASETDTLAAIARAKDQRYRDFQDDIERVIARLLDLPEACNSVTKIITNPGRCIDAVLSGEGCSTAEQCGYIKIGGIHHFMKKCNGQNCTEGQCTGTGTPLGLVPKCQAEKRAALQAEQAMQRFACESIKQKIRNVFKLKVKIKACAQRRDAKIKRKQSKINNARTAFCSAQAAYPDKKRIEDAKCAPHESQACGKVRKFYEPFDGTTTTCPQPGSNG